MIVSAIFWLAPLVIDSQTSVRRVSASQREMQLSTKFSFLFFCSSTFVPSERRRPKKRRLLSEGGSEGRGRVVRSTASHEVIYSASAVESLKDATVSLSGQHKLFFYFFFDGLSRATLVRTKWLRSVHPSVGSMEAFLFFFLQPNKLGFV